MIQTSSIKRLALPVPLIAIWPATAAVAGARHFGYVYEAVTSAPGSVDVENWITLEHLTAMPSFSQDVWWRAGWTIRMAEIAAQAGKKDLALEQLEISARDPAGVAYGDLKFNPVWDPLRGDPRFEKIVASLAPK